MRTRSTRNWILGIAIVLIGARLALPYIVKSYVNRVLAEIPGYYGHVADIDIALWRGAYRIDGIRFVKLGSRTTEPLFYATGIDLSVQWKALWHGSIVTEIEIENPRVTFIKGPTPAESQTSVDDTWQKQVQKLYPFQVNRLAVINGTVKYINNTTAPKTDIHMQSLDVEAMNLSNANRNEKDLFSTIIANGLLQKSGRFKAKMRLDALSEPAKADVDAELRGLDLVELNDFAKAYGNFDFEKGHAGIFIEMATQKNLLNGYAKVFFEGVDVADWKKEKDSVGHMLWESLVGGAFEILENQPRDTFASRIPISGKLDQPRVDGWTAFWSVLRNAFVQALPKKIDNSLGLRSVKGEKTKKN